MRFRALLASSCLAAFAQALVPAVTIASPWVLAPKEYASEVRFDFYSANDFHFAEGTRMPFAGGGHLDERRLTFWNELGWRPNLSAVIALPVTQVSRVFPEDLGASQPTATGAGDLFIALRYRLMGGEAGSNSVVSLEAGWKAPLGYDAAVRLSRMEIAYVDSVTDGQYLAADSANVMRHAARPRLGEGQQDLQGLLRFGFAMPGWNAFLQGAGGYRYRFDDPNDQIVLGADLGWWLTRRLLVSGHYEGTMALNEDDLDADGITEHLVGPRLTVRVDDRLDVFAGSKHSASAENAPHKDQVYVGFTMKQTGLDRLQGFLGGTKTP